MNWTRGMARTLEDVVRANNSVTVHAQVVAHDLAIQDVRYIMHQRAWHLVYAEDGLFVWKIDGGGYWFMRMASA